MLPASKVRGLVLTIMKWRSASQLTLGSRPAMWYLKQYLNVTGKVEKIPASTIPVSRSRTLNVLGVHLHCLRPLGLVRKVWLDIQLRLAQRGREGNWALTMTSFIIQRDEDGVEYVSQAHNPHTKNHNEPSDPHKETLRGFMFARP